MIQTLYFHDLFHADRSAITHMQRCHIERSASTSELQPTVTTWLEAMTALLSRIQNRH